MGSRNYHSLIPLSYFRVSSPDRSFVFWMGDLNYRIVADNEEARRLIAQGEFKKLHNFDQVRRQVLAVVFVLIGRAKLGMAVAIGCALPRNFHKFRPEVCVSTCLRGRFCVHVLNVRNRKHA